MKDQKCAAKTKLEPEIDMNSPEWREGLVEGSAPGALSAPNMSRGRTYAMGYLTAQIKKEPPSLRRH